MIQGTHQLLRPTRPTPLGIHIALLQSLLDGSRARRAWEGGERVGGEDEVAVGDGLTGDGGGWAVDEGLRVALSGLSHHTSHRRESQYGGVEKCGVICALTLL